MERRNAEWRRRSVSSKYGTECLCVCVCVATQEDELRRLREAVEAADQNRPPLRAIHGYSILDHLGSGAFGSVFKVQAQVIQWADIVAVCFPFQ